jgi:hypothetical protein
MFFGLALLKISFLGGSELEAADPPMELEAADPAAVLDLLILALPICSLTLSYLH